MSIYKVNTCECIKYLRELVLYFFGDKFIKEKCIVGKIEVTQKIVS